MGALKLVAFVLPRNWKRNCMIRRERNQDIVSPDESVQERCGPEEAGRLGELVAWPRQADDDLTMRSSIYRSSSKDKAMMLARDPVFPKGRGPPAHGGAAASA